MSKIIQALRWIQYNTQGRKVHYFVVSVGPLVLILHVFAPGVFQLSNKEVLVYETALCMASFFRSTTAKFHGHPLKEFI